MAYRGLPFLFSDSKEGGRYTKRGSLSNHVSSGAIQSGCTRRIAETNYGCRFFVLARRHFEKTVLFHLSLKIQSAFFTSFQTLFQILKGTGHCRSVVFEELLELLVFLYQRFARMGSRVEFR